MSFHLSPRLHINRSICLHVSHLSFRLSSCLDICLSVCLHVRLHIITFVFPSVFTSLHLSFRLSSRLNISVFPSVVTSWYLSSLRGIWGPQTPQTPPPESHRGLRDCWRRLEVPYGTRMVERWTNGWKFYSMFYRTLASLGPPLLKKEV